MGLNTFEKVHIHTVKLIPSLLLYHMKMARHMQQIWKICFRQYDVIPRLSGIFEICTRGSARCLEEAEVGSDADPLKYVQ